MDKKDKGPSEHKTMPFIQLKVDEDQGIVDHLITVFGVLDHGNDISHPGSFAKTLTERGGKVKVLDRHQTDSIMRVIGKPVSIKEVDKEGLPQVVLDRWPEATGGVKAKTQFLMETPEGAGAFARIKAGAVDEFSYGFDALDFDESTEAKDGEEVLARNLRQVRLWEYSPVIWGMNPATLTMSAKTQDDDGEDKDGEEPSEEKPVETTENYIRVRVKDPGSFQDDSFRTITISADQGIKAVIGKLKGETNTTIQTYLFDKDKWTTERAQAWVKEHEKAEAEEREQNKAQLRDIQIQLLELERLK